MRIPLAITLIALFAFAPTAQPAIHDGVHAQGEPADWKRAEAPSQPVYVGTGEHRYLWDSSWVQLPEGQKWLGATHGCITVDKRGRVYASADTGDAVLVFAPDGSLERSFGKNWGPGLHGITLVTESVAVETKPGHFEQVETEFLWLAHTARQEVLKTTLTGEVLKRIGIPTESGKYADPSRYKPTSVAVAPDGSLFVADGYGLSWIHRYDKAGKYLGSFGGPGDEPKNLRTPHGLWMDVPNRFSKAVPSLLVADRENHRLARFSLSGEFIEQTDPESGLFRRPCHIQFNNEGTLGIVADLAGRITLVDKNLKLIAQLGDNPNEAQRANFSVPPSDWKDGAFTAPHCARFDVQGNIYVMDWNIAGRITKLMPRPEPDAQD